MNEAAIKKRLEDLHETMALARPGKILPADAGFDMEPKARQSIEDVLDHLQVQVKYLLFDLEATWRENGYLRRMLETRNRQEPGEEGDSGNPPRWQ
jgi:hypothetical protein